MNETEANGCKKWHVRFQTSCACVWFSPFLHTALVHTDGLLRTIAEGQVVRNIFPSISWKDRNSARGTEKFINC